MNRLATVACGGLLGGLWLLGCGSSAVLDDGASGGAGGAASASSTESTTAGTGGQGPLCFRTHDELSVVVNTWDGLTLGCTSGAAETQGTFEYDGVLTYDGAGQITLDSCPPGANCAPQISTVRFEAKGLQPYLPSGVFAKLIVTTEQPGGCDETFFVLNLPEWGGVPNPVTAAPRLWLAGVDGTLDLPQGLPYYAEKRAYGCVSPASTRDYGLAFISNEDPTKFVEVSMGYPGSLDQGPGDTWLISDLRSFDSGAANDTGTWTYWIAQPFPPD